MNRQRFHNNQEVEVYVRQALRRGIVDARSSASAYGDYQYLGGYWVCVWVDGKQEWIRNDRRLIRPWDGYT